MRVETRQGVLLACGLGRGEAEKFAVASTAHDGGTVEVVFEAVEGGYGPGGRTCDRELCGEPDEDAAALRARARKEGGWSFTSERGGLVDHCPDHRHTARPGLDLP